MKYVLLLLIPSLSLASEEESAKRAIAEAFYKQSGIEKNVNHYIEENIVPKKHKKTLETIAIIINSAVSQKIEYKMEF